MAALYKTKQLQNPVILKWLKHSDSLANGVLDFLRKHYNENEPIFRYINLNRHDSNRKIMDQVYERCIECDASIVALEATSNEIIGVYLQDVKNCNKQANINEVISCLRDTLTPSPSLEMFSICLASINQEFNKQYPNAQNIIDHGFAVTHPAWNNEGVTSMAMDFFHRFMAKEMSCDLVYAVCTSHYTSRLLERWNYKDIWKMRYDQLNNGKQILFDIQPPHDTISCKVFEIPKYIKK